MNEIDAFHSSESKLSLSLADIKNINSINLDSVSKNMENVELTAFDDGKHKIKHYIIIIN